MTLLLDVARRYASLLAAATGLAGRSCTRPTLRRCLLPPLLVAGLPLWLAYHWLGLLLDEVLFRGYRRVEVEAPVFVLGVPRSGTTAVHRALAEDPHTTTFRTWECLFALSVTWRVVGRALARADAAVGRPLGRALDRLEARLAEGMSAIHPVDRHAPEEDYWALMPILACFILVVPFPEARAVWRLAHIDTALSPGERARIWRFYHRCVQRHLYFHGTGYRFLSKNAAFASGAASLTTRYPDARVLCCLREPREAVASQLAALDPALTALHGRYRRAELSARMLEALGLFYRHLLATVAALGSRAQVLPAGALRRDLHGTLVTAYTRLGLPVTPAFDTALWHRAHAPGPGRPHRARTLADFGLGEATLARQLGDVYRRVDFGARGPLPGHRPGPDAAAKAC